MKGARYNIPYEIKNDETIFVSDNKKFKSEETTTTTTITTTTPNQEKEGEEKTEMV